ncbi:MAG: hypothetical protein ACT4P6_19630 [Gemmatimonadaceae bacterium]
MQNLQRVVFVCEHGAAKSVLAATEFNAQAHARGLALRAVARGTAPDAAIAPVVVDRLAREGVNLGTTTPQALTTDDLDGALRVVTFDQPQVASMLTRDTPIDTWSGVPPVSSDFDRARQAIRSNVHALLDQLARDAATPR